MRYLPLMGKLLQTDLELFKRTILDKLIDLSIWIVTMVAVTAYLMPSFGLSQGYTGFLIASLVASAGLFELYTSATNLVSDFYGDNITSYYVTLPMPSWLTFVEKIIYYTINCSVIGIVVLPLSKLLAWNSFSFAECSFPKFFLIFVLSNLFYGAFTIWIASKIPGLEMIGSVWMRFVYPLWFLGGFQYSWNVLYEYNPPLAYISLLNPITYAMEGHRAAILGQPGSLNFWVCVLMLLVFTLLFGWHGMKLLKKKLDYI